MVKSEFCHTFIGKFTTVNPAGVADFGQAPFLLSQACEDDLNDLLN